MKTYIFLTNTISGVGGGQLYLADKGVRLRKEGWNVRIIFYKSGTIRIPSLRDYESGYCLGLSYSFPGVPEKIRDEISDKILEGVNPGERVVIESFNYQTALWGEYAARKAGGSHIFYLITESWNKADSLQKSFLRFKLNQQLLFGIASENIPSLIPEASGKETYLTALGCGINPESDGDVEGLDTLNKDYFTILCISRLEKGYLPEVLDEIEHFCASHPDETFNLILIGEGDSPRLKEDIENRLHKKTKNLKVLMPGSLYPIPRRVFEMADVAVECAGSARVTADNGVPTITVDARDFKGIGIYRETTQNKIYRFPEERPISVASLLEVIYERPRIAAKNEFKPTKDDAEIFRIHLEIIKKAPTGDYFPLENIRVKGWKDFLTQLLLNFGGRRLLDRIKLHKLGL